MLYKLPQSEVHDIVYSISDTLIHFVLSARMSGVLISSFLSVVCSLLCDLCCVLFCVHLLLLRIVFISYQPALFYFMILHVCLVCVFTWYDVVLISHCTT